MSKFVLTAQLQLQAPGNTRQVINQLRSQLQGQLNIPVSVTGSVQATKQIKQVAQQTQQATTAANNMGKAFGASIKRFAAFNIATRAVGLLASKLSQAVDEAIEFQRQLVKISQVTGKTIGQLKGLTDEITRLSTTLGVSSTALLGTTRILAQAGIQAGDLKVALEALAKTTLAPTFDNITQTAEGAVAILAQFGQGVGALEQQLGAINAVAGQFAVESGDLISSVRRMGGVFRQAGGDLNELLALFTSVRATTRENAESISTGLRTIFTRIQRPQTIEYLKQFGVELTDLNGKFIGPYEAVRQLSKALAGLDRGDIRFVEIAEQLGGFRQIGKVIPLLQQFEVAEKARQAAIAGGNSLNEDAVTAQQALAVQIEKTREKFLALIRSISETSTFRIMIESLLGIANAFIKVAEAIKPIIPLIAAFAAVKLTKGLGSFASGLGAGLKGKNQGGKIHAFARGGTVPGSGNRDTVPAMLTPGEFVIRKSSVNKIGTGTLAAMNENKYAAGGTVVPKNPEKYAAFVLDSKSGGDLATKAVALSESANRAINITQGRMDDPKSALTKTKYKEITGDHRGNTLPKDGTEARTKLDEAFKRDKPGVSLSKYAGVQDLKTLKKGEENTYKIRGPFSVFGIGSPDTVQSDLQQEFAKGSEAAIKAGATSVEPYLVDKLSVGPLKFKQGKGGFDLEQVLEGAAPTIEGYLLEAVIGAVGNLKTGGPKGGSGIRADFDFANVTAEAKEKLANLFDPNDDISKVSKADAKRTYATAADKKSGLHNKIAKDLNKGEYTLMASGGPVGTDTVPAMLTPGEFVINKKASQSIGYGNLNRMNKQGVVGYASGGPVGVQYFANGSPGGVQGVAGFDIVEALRKVISEAKQVANKEGPRPGASSDFSGVKAAGKKAQARSHPDSAGVKGIEDEGMKELADQAFKTVTDLRDAAEAINESEEGSKEMKKAQDSLTDAYYTSKEILEDLKQRASELWVEEQRAAKPSDARKAAQAASTGNMDVYSSSRGLSEQQRMTSDKEFQGSLDDDEKGVSDRSKREQAMAGPVPPSTFPIATVPRKPATGASMVRREPERWTTVNPQPQPVANLTETTQEKLAPNTGMKRNTSLIKAEASLDKKEEASSGCECKAEFEKLYKGIQNLGNATGEGFKRLADAILSGADPKNINVDPEKAVVPLSTTEEKAAVEHKKDKDKADVEGTEAEKTQATLQKMAALTGGMVVASTAASAFSEKLFGADDGITYFVDSFGGAVSTMVGGFATFNGLLTSVGGFDKLKEHLGSVGAGMSVLRAKLNGASAASTAAAVADEKQAVGSHLATAADKKEALTSNVATAADGREALMSNVSTAADGAEATASLGVAAVLAPFAVIGLAIAAVVIGLYAWADSIRKGAEKRQQDAIDKGDIEGFEKATKELVLSDNAKTAISVAGVAATAGTGAAAAAAGSNPGIMFAEWMGYFSNYNDALVANADKIRDFSYKGIENALAKSAKKIDQASKDLSEGLISSAEAADIFAASGADKEFAKQDKLLQKTAAAEKEIAQNKGGGGFFDWGGVMGLGRSAADIEKGETNRQETEDKRKENAAKVLEAKQFVTSKKMDDAAVTGGSFDQFWASLSTTTQEQYKVAGTTADLEKAYNNKLKAVQENIKYLKALNFGFRDVNGVAMAASGSMERLVASQETGFNAFDQSIQVLEQSMTEAAIGMDPAEIGKAADDLEQTLLGFGADPKAAKEASNTVKGLSAAQAGASKALKAAAGKLIGPGGGISANKDDIQKEFKGAVKAQLANLNLGEDVENRILNGLGDINFSDPKVQAQLASGDFSALIDQSFGPIAEETKKQVLGAMKEKAKQDGILIKLTRERIQLEQQANQAKKAAIDIEMEAAQAIADFGGRQVTSEDKKSAINRKLDIDLSAAGIGSVGGGSTNELAAAQQNISGDFNALQQKSNLAAQGGKGAFAGSKGVEEDKRPQLEAAQQSLITATRARIALVKEEMDIIKRKNELEKSSLDKLLSGDIEGFFEGQAATGAASALRTGNQALIGSFSASSVGRGFQDLQGQNLPAQQMERIASGALGSLGVQDRRSAQVLSGNTAEEQAKRAEGQQLAGILGAAGAGAAEMAEMAVDAKLVVIKTQGLKVEEARTAAGMASGGVVYANRGIFVPRGTDTVPAMLTPGEFVVNRSSVQRGNNLAILQAMNNGQQAAPGPAMNRGGSVRYYSNGSDGGVQPGGGGFSISPETVTSLNNAFSGFSTAVDKLVGMQLSVKLDATNVNVNFSGTSFLGKLTDTIREEVLKEVKNQIPNISQNTSGGNEFQQGVL